MMTCRELQERLGDWQAGELRVSTLLSLRLHAAFCPCCRHLLTTYGTTVELANELGRTEVAPLVAADFEAMIRRAREQSSPS